MVVKERQRIETYYGKNLGWRNNCPYPSYNICEQIKEAKNDLRIEINSVAENLKSHIKDEKDRKKTLWSIMTVIATIFGGIGGWLLSWLTSSL